MKLRRHFRRAWLGVLSAMLLAALGSLPESAQATGTNSARWSVWSTNGIVDSVLPVGKLLYVGGLFTDIGPYTGGGAAIGRRTGLPVTRLSVVGGKHDGQEQNGEVLAAVSDHHGGYFVGATGRAIPLDVLDVHGTFALAVSGSSLYVGGDDGVATVPITP